MEDDRGLLNLVSVHPDVCFGRPCIRGTRIWVSLLVENLAAGIPEQEILTAYPQLEPDDIRAAVEYSKQCKSQHEQ